MISRAPIYLLLLILFSSNMLCHALRIPSGTVMVPRNFQRDFSKWRPKYHKRKLASHFTVKDLPSETLYILDGTAMLYYAYHSRESKKMEDAFFTPEFTNQLLEKLPPGFRRAREQLIQEQAANASAMGHNNGEHPSSRMSCAALTVMASHFARFVREVRPTYLAVTFDVSRSTLKRTRLFSAYKKQRRAAPSDLLPQFLVAPAIFQAMGCHCLALKGYEADDLMASLSRWARASNVAPVNVAIVSQDKDLLQLADTGVHIVKPLTMDVIGPDDVVARYGVAPKQLPDIFALAGDVSDNIPGAEGIGLKTSAKLITTFGDIGNMYKALGLSSLPPMASPAEPISDETDESEEEEKEEVKNLKEATKLKKKKNYQQMRQDLLQHFALQCAGDLVSAEAKLTDSLELLQVTGMPAIRILSSLACLGEERALLYRHLVTLDHTVEWQQALLPLQHKHRHNNNNNNSKNNNSKNNNNNNNNNNDNNINSNTDMDNGDFEFVSLLDLTPAGGKDDRVAPPSLDQQDAVMERNDAFVSFFRFTGETSVDLTGKWLAGVSPSLLKPLNLLRQQYHHLR